MCISIDLAEVPGICSACTRLQRSMDEDVLILFVRRKCWKQVNIHHLEANETRYGNRHVSALLGCYPLPLPLMYSSFCLFRSRLKYHLPWEPFPGHTLKGGLLFPLSLAVVCSYFVSSLVFSAPCLWMWTLKGQSEFFTLASPSI